MRTADEIDVLEMKVRGLERELRDMRETLRDRFAMHAMNSLLAYNAPDKAAQFAYLTADAMLAARAEDNNPKKGQP